MTGCQELTLVVPLQGIAAYTNDPQISVAGQVGVAYPAQNREAKQVKLIGRDCQGAVATGRPGSDGRTQTGTVIAAGFLPAQSQISGREIGIAHTVNRQQIGGVQYQTARQGQGHIAAPLYPVRGFEHKVRYPALDQGGIGHFDPTIIIGRQGIAGFQGCKIRQGKSGLHQFNGGRVCSSRRKRRLAGSQFGRFGTGAGIQFHHQASTGRTATLAPGGPDPSLQHHTFSRLERDFSAVGRYPCSNRSGNALCILQQQIQFSRCAGHIQQRTRFEDDKPAIGPEPNPPTR